MTISLGRVIAELAEPSQEMPTELVALINYNVKPPSPVTADDVFIRAMYVVSDQVNSFGGRFPAEEHEHLAELLVDSPILVGHRKDQLPVGRTFHAVTVERQGHPWVKSYFYWLKSSERSEEFRANLDGGIYKECSIAFTFQLPECSICGKDIRRCRHQPFESYGQGEVSEKCHFNYRQVERVLETSLVYRGAVPDTSVVRDLEDRDGALPVPARDAIGLVSAPVDHLDALDDSDLFLVTPHYDGLPVAASVAGGRLTLTRSDGTTLAVGGELAASSINAESPIPGILVGQRGKERCSCSSLDDFLHGRTSPVTRMVLNLLPHMGVIVQPRIHSRSALEVRILPHRVASREKLDQAVREIQTKDGADIRALGSAGLRSSVHAYWYRPPAAANGPARRPSIMLTWGGEGSGAVLRLDDSIGSERSSVDTLFELTDFDPRGLLSGRCFLARRVDGRAWRRPSGKVMSGRVEMINRQGEAWSIEAAGELAGTLVLRPVRVGGQDRYLFHRVAGDQIGRSR